MNTQTKLFTFKISIHLFNGYAVEVGGFGVIKQKEEALPEETILALIRLGTVLRPIYARLISNGFYLVDGKLVKPESLEQKV